MSQAAPYRSIPISKRDDLEIVEQTFRGQKSIIVGDPLSLEYHRFNEQEFALLNWLDGKRSAEEIKRQFEDTFSPYLIDHREIEQYLIQFHKKNLVHSTVSNVGAHLQQRSKTRQLQKSISKMKSLLSFRMRGWNPELFLEWLTPKSKWFFSKGMIAINLLIMTAAILLICSHWQQFQSRLPSLQEFFAPKNWIAVGILVLFTKVLHELGHGVVFTKFGGRCHELGVMIMLFMPTLYVNASGSWKFPDKWKRAAVGAAGMYVELTLAAIATFVWWYSQPGIIQYFALNIMATCSFSSVLLNGNPLMRYDGYFILSDILEIPNLQQRASIFFRDQFLRTGLGVNETSESQSTDRTKRILVLYAIASYLYRYVVVYGVAFVFLGYLRSAGLEVVAKWFSFFSIGSLVALPVIGIISYFRQPGRLARVKAMHQNVLVVLVSLAGLAFFVLPLPYSVVANFVVEPKEMATVYSAQTGPVTKLHVQPGEWVEKGQPIVTQRSIDLEIEIEKIKGELASLKKRERFDLSSIHPSSADIRERCEIRATIVAKEAALSELFSKLDQLTIRAPRTGHLISNWVNTDGNQSVESLDGFQGWTISRDLQSMIIQRGQIVCRVGDRTQLEAKLFLDQSDLRAIQIGQSVRLLVDSNTNQILNGKIRNVSIQNAERVESAMTLRYGGTIEASPSATSRSESLNSDATLLSPAAPIYLAMVEFEEAKSDLPSGFRGTSKITLANKTAFWQLNQFLTKLFRFDL